MGNLREFLLWDACVGRIPTVFECVVVHSTLVDDCPISHCLVEHGSKGRKTPTAVRGLVCGGRPTNGHIVNVWYSVLWNLWLKNMCNVVVEYGYCVDPTHQKLGQAECAIWCLQSGVVTRGFSECTLIVTYIQVKHPSTGMTCELLSDLFSEGSDARMLDCDGVCYDSHGLLSDSFLFSHTCSTSDSLFSHLLHF